MAEHEAFVHENFILDKQLAVFAYLVNREPQNYYDCVVKYSDEMVVSFKGKNKESQQVNQCDNKKSQILHYTEYDIAFGKFSFVSIRIPAEY